MLATKPPFHRSIPADLMMRMRTMTRVTRMRTRMRKMITMMCKLSWHG